MSMAPRDAEAFEVASQGAYANAFVVSLGIEMQTRRLTLELYGTLHGGRTTYLATLTFFGIAGLELENDGSVFPESVQVVSFSLSYNDDEGSGRADLRGTRGWTLAWSFDGLAYEERAALMASLADDDTAGD